MAATIPKDLPTSLARVDVILAKSTERLCTEFGVSRVIHSLRPSRGNGGHVSTKFAVSAISEGLRHAVREKGRVTSIEPGAVESDLKFTTSGAAAETVLDFYKQAIPAASVARAIAFAVEQPDDVDVNAIVIRPTAQQF